MVGVVAATSGGLASFPSVGIDQSTPGANVVVSPERGALLSSRAYSASAMAQVKGGSVFNLLVVNKGGSATRLVFDRRWFATDNPTGQIAAKYYSLANPTINLPTTAAAARNRANFGPVSSAVSVFYSTSTATATSDGGGGFPDGSPSVPLLSRLGGILPTGGHHGGPDDIEATIDPGSSVVYSIVAVANAGTLASTDPFLSFLVTWDEVALTS